MGIHSTGYRMSARAAACAVAFLACAAALPTPASAASDSGIVARYASALGRANARLSAPSRLALAQRLLLLASYYDVEPALLVAIVTVESSWHARAVSPVGALGYGQLMPTTAARLDVDALEPYENLDGTARYLRRMLKHFTGRAYAERVRLAVASYNAGPGAVDRYGGVPPYRETREYVANVLRWRADYAQLSAGMEGFDVGAVVARAAHPRPAIARAKPPKSSVAHRRIAHRHAPAPPEVAAAPYHSPYLDAPDPNAYETPPPIPPTRHGIAGFFGRVFGHHTAPVAPPLAVSAVNREDAVEPHLR